MTIAEMIKKDITIDMYDDYNEELGMAFVGPLGLTAEGKKRFRWVLGQEVETSGSESDPDYIEGIVHVESGDEVAAYKEFFEAAAGYCGEYLYSHLFKNYIEEKGSRGMTIEFTDREYRFEHGRAPKGYGYWGFEYEGRQFWTTGTLTQAKAACRKEIRKQAPEGYAYVVVTVLP